MCTSAHPSIAPFAHCMLVLVVHSLTHGSGHAEAKPSASQSKEGAPGYKTTPMQGENDQEE
jgi:hypothetical protein